MLNSSFCAHPKLEGIFDTDRKMIESKIKVKYQLFVEQLILMSWHL